MSKNPLDLALQHLESVSRSAFYSAPEPSYSSGNDWLDDVLAGKHAPRTATPEEAREAAKATLAAVKRAHRPRRPRRKRPVQRPAVTRPLSAFEKDVLRRKFWMPGGYDPKTAADIVDKLLS